MSRRAMLFGFVLGVAPISNALRLPHVAPGGALRTRRGRLEKARSGEFIPWAYRCYGYRYPPKQHGSGPQVMIEPAEAHVVREIYRALVEEQLSRRQIAKRLKEAETPNSKSTWDG